MEQNKDKKSPNQGKDPKMPKFNMGWLYMLILVALIYVFMTDAGNSLTNSAVGGVRQEATYTKFKEYVDSGYAKKVEVNTTERKLKMFVKTEHIRDVFNRTAQETGPEPFVTVEYGSPAISVTTTIARARWNEFSTISVR